MKKAFLLTILIWSTLLFSQGFAQQKQNALYSIQQPSFPGGINKLYSFIDKNLRYPERAKKNSVEGKVFIKFTVEKDGRLTNFAITRSLSKETDEEALRVLKTSPNWTPGIENGRNVRVMYHMTINFKLS